MDEAAYRRYINSMSHNYDSEVRIAHQAGCTWGTAPGEDFMRIADEGDRLIYVVTEERELIIAAISPSITHAVIATGLPVLAAGECDVAVYGEFKMVLDVSNKSGHYLPDAGCLDLVQEVFEDLDFVVGPGVFSSYRNEGR